MLWYAHVFIATAAISFFTTDPYMLAFGAIVSILPDLDGKFGHRGWFSHSLLAVALLGSAVYWASGSLAMLVVAAIALFSHIAADIITFSGLPLFHPGYRNAVAIPLIESKSKLANKAFMLVSIAVLSLNVLAKYKILFRFH